MNKELLLKERNRKIQESILRTREKRKEQIPITLIMQLVLNKRWQIEYINALFREAKYLYNHTLADIENRLNIYTANKIKEVEVKVGNKTEKRQLEHLSSHMKQGIQGLIIQNMKSLKARKEKGYKIGRLKFKKEFTIIPLTNQSFKIKGNRLAIQKIGRNRSIYLRGIKQLDQIRNRYGEFDIGNSKLVKRAGKVYFHLTLFVDRSIYQEHKESKLIGDILGIDLGIKDQITFNNGLKLKWQINETARLKRIQKSLFKKKKGSKNREKCRLKLRREYQRIANIKRNIRNKIKSYCDRYETIYFQKELVKQWHEGWFGKQVQYSSLGQILESLRRHSNPVELDSSVPTTKMCSNCGYIMDEISLDQRIFECHKCNHRIDRDINSALNMICYSIGQVPLEQGELTPVEKETSVSLFSHTRGLEISHTSMKQEATPFRVW